MRSSKVIVLAVALGAGLMAFLMMRSMNSGQPEVVRVEQSFESMDVLVASREIRTGERISPSDLRWEKWPASDEVSVIRREMDPDAAERLVGRVTRSAMLPGEPIRETKLVESGSGGYMSAILPAGKRAVSTPVSPETGAGGFILPNDRVDVIVTRTVEDRASDNGQTSVSETVLQNVRILAIDQTIEEQDGDQVVVGSVATLEVDGRQAETLALASRVGEISLALRSVMDANADPDEGNSNLNGGRVGSVNVVRFGVPGRVVGAQ